MIALYESMLSATTVSSSPDEAFITVIGYLEASVPCLTDLIEAAPQGALNEITFEQCLLMNDKLTSVLATVVYDYHDYREEGLPPALNAISLTSNVPLKTPEEDRVDDDERYSLHGNDVQRHIPLNDDAAEVLAARSNQQPSQVQESLLFDQHRAEMELSLRRMLLRNARSKKDFPSKLHLLLQCGQKINNCITH